MSVLYKRWKKHNETQLTKNKMDLNIRKMTNHPPSPSMAQKNKLPFSMAIGNDELKHECFPKLLRSLEVFSQTLAHGYSKNEIRYGNR